MQEVNPPPPKKKKKKKEKGKKKKKKKRVRFNFLLNYPLNSENNAIIMSEISFPRWTLLNSPSHILLLDFRLLGNYLKQNCQMRDIKVIFPGKYFHISKV